MTIVHMSIWEKIYFFVVCPIHDLLFPRTPEEIEREKQEAMQKMMAKGFHFATTGAGNDPRYRPNRKRDGEEMGRP
jgi:hypothetical protein